MAKICVTGHRPQKMYGYDIYNKQWMELKEQFKKLLIENRCDEAIICIIFIKKRNNFVALIP